MLKRIDKAVSCEDRHINFASLKSGRLVFSHVVRRFILSDVINLLFPSQLTDVQRTQSKNGEVTLTLLTCS